MADSARSRWLSAMCAAFRDRYASEVAFEADRALGAVLEREAAPLCAALLDSGLAVDRGGTETASPPAVGAVPKPEVDLHDVFALLTLLAREVAARGGTPASALALSPSLAAAAAARGTTVPPAMSRTLTLLAVEGYCAAREERAIADLRRRAAEAQTVLELAPGVFVVALQGHHDAGDLTPVLEELGRVLFRADARSCVLELSRLSGDDLEVARAVAELCADVVGLGIALFIVGASATLRDRLGTFSVAPSGGFMEQFPRAIEQALAQAGLEVSAPHRWRRLLRARGSKQR